MLKTTAIAVLAGLVTLTTVLPSAAQFAVPGAQRYPQGGGNTYDCSAAMGHMRSVKQSDIAAIKGNRIALLPVCEDLTVPGKNVYGALFVNGNVNHLRVPIARNATLMNALGARGYDQNDVVSLRFGSNDSIILYVHQRDMQ
ncbi:hypothetical protein DMC47_03775 [Nostoc sp. 3335mG]|nr:hypothetical protein DMC47_03775 [Nostoc sp. 3335mG]